MCYCWHSQKRVRTVGFKCVCVCFECSVAADHKLQISVFRFDGFGEMPQLIQNKTVKCVLAEGA